MPSKVARKTRDKFEELCNQNRCFNMVLDDSATWICPYCGQPAVDDCHAPDFPDAALAHLLDACPKADGLNGPIMPVFQMEEVQLFYRLKSRYMSDKAWRIQVAGGAWLCPFCVEPTDVTILDKSGQPLQVDDVVRNIRSHLKRCFPYSQTPNKWQTLDRVKEILRKRKEAEMFGSMVSEQLNRNPVFQFADKNGRWICPFCEKSIGNVDVSSPMARQHTAPQQIVGHFLSGTCVYREGPPDPRKTVEHMQQVAARFQAPKPGGTDALNVQQMQFQAMQQAMAAQQQAMAAQQQQALAAQQQQALAAQQQALAGQQQQARPDVESTRYMDALRNELGDLRSHLDQNAEFRQNIERARKVQQRMLPMIPTTIPGYEFSAYYHACDHISGDFYDFIKLPDGRIGVVMGDVSGHGLDAGLVMGITKKAFSLRAQTGEDPLTVVARVNGDIIPDLDKSTFVTGVYGILDPNTHQFRFVRFGHTFPSYFKAKSREVVDVKSNGLMLGSVRDELFRRGTQMTEVFFGPGDAMVIFTDGFMEAMTEEKEEFGMDRLHGSVQRHGHSSAMGIIEGLLGSIQIFTRGFTQSDDQTVLVLKRIQ